MTDIFLGLRLALPKYNNHNNNSVNNNKKKKRLLHCGVIERSCEEFSYVCAYDSRALDVKLCGVRSGESRLVTPYFDITTM